MKSQLTEKQWNEVVAEVTRLAQVREGETTKREITVQVLQELNLPTDLIDDAIKQVQYREALDKQRRQRWWLAIVAAVLAFLLAGSIVIWKSSHSAALSRVTADAGQVTRTINQSENSNVAATAGREVVFQTKLRDVPLGEKLQLSCDWFDPAGKVFHQSRWETRETNKALWETQCRCQLSQNAPKGTWKVELKLGERVLTGTEFKVE